MTDTFVTQCPHCQTRFRVNRPQLDAARGMARCGTCLQVFNAAQNLLTPAAMKEAAPAVARAPATEPAPTDKPAAASQQPQPGLWSHDDLDLADLDLDNLDLDAELAKLEALERQQQLERSAAAAEPAPAPAARTRDKEPRITTFRPTKPAAAPPPEHEEPAPPPTSSLLITPSGKGERSEPTLSLDRLIVEDDEHDDRLVAEPDLDEEPIASPERTGRKQPEQPAEALFELDEEPLQLDWQKPRKPWGRWLGWGLLNLLAAAALAGQYVWYHFDELARQEDYRPWFEELCPMLGCSLPPRVDIGQIKSSNLVVRKHPEFSGALVVDAIIYNRTSFAQPFPLLELRFTDLNGLVVASRRFKPGEYLGGELAGQEQMPPQTPIHIALEILDPGPRAVNYSLSFHSPE